ncbi:unnamed protein product [Closterium sp. NIES-53]
MMMGRGAGPEGRGYGGRGMGMEREREREVDAWRRGTRIEEESQAGGGREGGRDGWREAGRGDGGRGEVGRGGGPGVGPGAREGAGGAGGGAGGGGGGAGGGGAGAGAAAGTGAGAGAAGGPGGGAGGAKAGAGMDEESAVAKANSALEEFLSARDFKEVCLCIEELQAPQHHGAVVAGWVAAGLDKKEAQRQQVEDLVVRLCCEPKPPLFTSDQIQQGLVRVFQELEDWSVDAPKAPQHVGRLIGRLVAAGAIPLADVARLVKSGGAEEGSLVEMGEGMKVMAAVVGAVRAEKGEKEAGEMVRVAGIEGPEEFMEERARGRKEKVEEARKALGLAGATDPLQAVAEHLKDAFAKGESAEAVLKWLQANTPPDTPTQPALLRLLMRSLLQQCIGASRQDFKKLLAGPVKKYDKVFHEYAAKKQKPNQVQYLFGAQEYAESCGHPAGLLDAVFRTLYDLDVVEELMIFRWQDDNKDPTPGKQKAYLDVRHFLTWLSTAQEEGTEENGGSGDEKA